MAPNNPKKRQASEASTSAPPKGIAFRKSSSASKKAKLNGGSGSNESPKQPPQRNQNQRPQPLKSAMKTNNVTPSASSSKSKPPVSIATGKGKAVQVQPAQPTKSKQPAPKKQSSKTTHPTPTSSSSSSAPTQSQPQTAWIHPPPALPTFRIMTGSYERLLYGLKVTQSPTSSSSSLDLDLKPMFQFPAHPSSIKCLATGGATSKYLVTAGQDELIKIWDLRRKKEVGSLSGAESYGPPIAFEFPLSSHLLLTAEGVILLYRTRDWALLHTFKGHTGRVNFVSTHPSARLALSGGQDGVLRAWDLLRGKSLGGTKIGMGHGGEMERLAWFGSNKGHFFALLGRTVVRIFRKSMAEVARIGQGTLTATRLNDVAVWDLPEDTCPGKSLILVAREDKQVGVYVFDKAVFDELDKRAEEDDNANEGGDEDDDEDDDEEKRTLKEIAWLQGHQARVKAVSIQPISTPSDSSTTLTATTISSDGHVRIFNLHDILSAITSNSLDSSSPLTTLPTTSFSTKGARLTCLSTCGGDGTMRGSRADDDYDDDDDDDDDEEEEGDVAAGKGHRGAAASEDESDFVSDYEAQEGAPIDEESELKQLEDVLREAKRQGIDLDLLVNGGLDMEESGSEGDAVDVPSDADEDEDEEEEEVDDDDDDEE